MFDSISSVFVFVISIVVLLSPFVLYVYFRTKKNLIFVADIYMLITFLLFIVYIVSPHLYHDFCVQF